MAVRHIRVSGGDGPGSAGPGNPTGLSVANLTAYKNLDLGTTGINVFVVSGGIFYYFFKNNASTVRYVKLYDKASIPTTADVPAYVIPIPGTAGANAPIPNGLLFSSGLGLRASTGIADNDGASPATNDVIVNIGYRT